MMTLPPLSLPLAAAVGGLVILLTGLVRRWLVRRQILDRPNDRSSHTLPTPRGGGLAVVPVVLAAWAVHGAPAPFGTPALTWAVLLGAALLAGLSWLDDRHTLPPLPRFLAQIAGVAAVLLLLPAEALVFQGLLPAWLDRLVAGFAWLWFVNLTNFMDGIDGITGVETASVGLGLALLAALGLAGPAVGVPGVVLLAAALGFLVWNWHPARLFMGDVGSIPLGFLMGFLLIVLAADGQLAAAILLPLYYLTDATVTLLKRLVRREKVWQAHRSHFYQQAVQKGLSHARVSGAVAVVNLGLIGCALAAAAGWPVPALAGGAVLVTALCWRLSRGAAGLT